ncbi:hypothetical protein BIW11_07768 [Tropilaelaps mercedesae]|uniref:Uncharacterized protein n=1 Tax=Tropilaelaps mercedesae TaxID=418985 RepID=A0A1V9XSQ2_9ACAR|nr:hypothetical protein BIW11_07768 [Tropilaelaps mercedesae]
MPDCCNPNNQMFQCFTIHLPVPYQVYGNRDCMNPIRSEPCPQCAVAPREQINAVTPYIDFSHIYLWP